MNTGLSGFAGKIALRSASRGPRVIGGLLFVLLTLWSALGMCSVRGVLIDEDGKPLEGGMIVFISSPAPPIRRPVGPDGSFAVEGLKRGESYDVGYISRDGGQFRMKTRWTYGGKEQLAFALLGDILIEYPIIEQTIVEDESVELLPTRQRVVGFFGAGSIPGERFNGEQHGNEVSLGFVVGAEYYIPAGLLRLSGPAANLHLVVGGMYATNTYEVNQITGAGRGDVTYRRYNLRVGCSYLPKRKGLGIGGGVVLGSGSFLDGSRKMSYLGQDFDHWMYGAYLNISYSFVSGPIGAAVRLEPTVSITDGDYETPFLAAGEDPFWDGEVWTWNLVLAISH